MNASGRVRAALAITILLSTAITAALAAKTLSAPASSVTLGGTSAPLVTYLAGANSGASDHVSSFSISTNGTKFSTTLSGYAGTTTSIKDLVKIKNVHNAAHAVTLSGNQVTNALVTKATIEVFNGAASLGTLDLKVANPTLNLGSVAANATYTCRVEYAFAVGAGANNATLQLNVRLGVVP